MTTKIEIKPHKIWGWDGFRIHFYNEKGIEQRSVPLLDQPDKRAILEEIESILDTLLRQVK